MESLWKILLDSFRKKVCELLKRFKLQIKNFPIFKRCFESGRNWRGMESIVRSVQRFVMLFYCCKITKIQLDSFPFRCADFWKAELDNIEKYMSDQINEDLPEGIKEEIQQFRQRLATQLWIGYQNSLFSQSRHFLYFFFSYFFSGVWYTGEDRSRNKKKGKKSHFHHWLYNS